MMLSGHTGGGRRLFTASQWQELEHQALIYKYMATGAPVPHDLVLPLRLATGVDTVPSLAFPSHQPPSSLGYWGCYGAAAAQFGRKAEDPEPGRCRRTDGKKWRCSREAFGDSKYCEKHIHRGKNRSRKPVEPTTSATLAAALSISPPAPQPAYSHHHHHLHHRGASAANAHQAPPPLQLHLDAGYHHHAPSPPPSYHRYAHGGGGYGGLSSAREMQEAEMRRQRCLALGADLSLEKPATGAAAEKPLRRFFDEWTGGGVDDATQLSISMPTASPADLAAARYHNGE